MDWKDERNIAKLKEMWSDGATLSEIAKEFGCSRNAVVGKLNRLGLSSPAIDKWPPEKVEKLKALWAAGVSKRVIAMELGFSKTSVFSKGTRLGLRGERPIPPSRRPKRNRPLPRVPKNEAPPLSVDQKEFILGAGITLLELEPHHCRWPLNETKKGGQYFFCGEKKRQDGPYCPYHTDVAQLGMILADMKHARLTGKKQEAA